MSEMKKLLNGQMYKLFEFTVLFSMSVNIHVFGTKSTFV